MKMINKVSFGKSAKSIKLTVYKSFTFITLFLLTLILPLSSFNSVAFANGVGEWTVTSSMTYARYHMTATLLPSGKVLVAGGDNGSVSAPVSNSAELYDPTTSTWTLTNNMLNNHSLHTATLLQNGKVLIAGGAGTNTAELYDPTTSTWSEVTDMNRSRIYDTATLLSSGKVLIAGGYGGGNTAEVYDPVANTWTLTNPMVSSIFAHTATLLPNGKVLIAGGVDSSNQALASSEIYDPSTNSWTTTGNMSIPRVYHAAVLLSSGKVLVAGGQEGYTGGSTVTNTAELYDPSTGSWSLTQNMLSPTINHTLELLNNGDALVSGGETGTSIIPYGELYDPSTGSWSATNTMMPPRTEAKTAHLNNDSVLDVGGIDSNTNAITNSAELFALNQSPTLVQAINAGGDTQGNYIADTDFSGGTSYSSSNIVDTSGVTNPAPQAVYQTVRYGNTFSYTVPNLTANGTYTVRLHFNELYWGTSLSGNSGGVGSRVFNVSINGTQVLNNFDIYQTAGGANRANIQQFQTTADNNGNIMISFSTVTDNAMVNGIDIYSGTLPSPTPTPTPTPSSSVAIDSGGTTQGSFLSDEDYSGGTPYTSTTNVDTSHVTNPAPQAVYQSVRYGNAFSYIIPNLYPSTTYNVRLHFNELYWTSAGQRVFNVAINGNQVLSNYDIFQDAGGANIAVVKSFTTTSDSNGKITIQFSTVTDNAMVNGIEIVQQ